MRVCHRCFPRSMRNIIYVTVPLAVPGRPSAPPSEPSRKLYRLKNMAVPGDDSDTLESTAPFAPPHRNSYRLKDLDVMSDTSSGEQETMAVFLAGGRPLSLQHDARDHGLRPRTRRLKYEGDRGGPGSRTARRRQPQGTRSACSSSDAREFECCEAYLWRSLTFLWQVPAVLHIRQWGHL